MRFPNALSQKNGEFSYVLQAGHLEWDRPPLTRHTEDNTTDNKKGKFATPLWGACPRLSPLPSAPTRCLTLTTPLPLVLAGC